MLLTRVGTDFDCKTRCKCPRRAPTERRTMRLDTEQRRGVEQDNTGIGTFRSRVLNITFVFLIHIHLRSRFSHVTPLDRVCSDMVVP